MPAVLVLQLKSISATTVGCIISGHFCMREDEFCMHLKSFVDFFFVIVPSAFLLDRGKLMFTEECLTFFTV